MYRSYQRKMQQEEQKLSEPVIKLVVEVITAYGKKEGYTTITDAQASGLIYADEKADLTEKIMVEVNQAWRAKNKGKK
jgi:outer membrane protein